MFYLWRVLGKFLHNDSVILSPARFGSDIALWFAELSPVGAALAWSAARTSRESHQCWLMIVGCYKGYHG